MSGMRRTGCGSTRTSRVLHLAIIAALLINAVALGFALFADLLSVRKDVSLRFFAFRFPIVSEENTVSVASSLVDFYRRDETLLFFLVLVFAVIVPLVKFFTSVGIFYFVSEQVSIRWLCRLEKISRWSMTDVFVVALLVATLNLGDAVDVRIHAGFYWFTAAALIPMLNGVMIHRALLMSAQSHCPN